MGTGEVMRYRNVKQRAKRVGRGNLHTSLVGRDARAQLFAPSESSMLFEPDLSRAEVPILSVDGQTMPHETPPVEWAREQVKKPIPDNLPADVPPQDRRPGGQDEYTGSGAGALLRNYTADADTMARDLDVSTPTLANVVQVLNALLTDMAREFTVVRK